jgi:hypothetical protein
MTAKESRTKNFDAASLELVIVFTEESRNFLKLFLPLSRKPDN